MRTALIALCAGAAAVLALAAQPSVDLSLVVGATHWAPCYYMNQSLPSLVDGAVMLAPMQTRLIKLNLDGPSNYPWNSQWPAKPFATMTEQAQHPYFQTVFSNAAGTSYAVYVLVADRACPAGTTCGSICSNFSSFDLQDTTKQFSDVTQYLMSTYAGSGKRFIFQHWEGDWMSRCGGYNASAAAAPWVQANMVRWLQARQDGVDAGRLAYCAAAGLPECAGLDTAALSRSQRSALGARIMSTAGAVQVYHASEVNLIGTSMREGFPNNILQVIPHVALDFVSYSSYDTMQQAPGFGQALDFIMSHHNRTAASPENGFYIGEYGVPQMLKPFADLQNCTENVISYAVNRGASHIIFWELYCNEARYTPDSRCHASTGPVFKPEDLGGFWLVLPNGTAAEPVYSWAFWYLRGIINGSIPVPLPPV